MVGFDVELLRMAQVEVVELRQELSNKIDAYRVIDPKQSGCLQYLSKLSDSLDISVEIGLIENPDPIDPSAWRPAIAAILAVTPLIDEYELMTKGIPECRGVEAFDDMLAKYRTVKWRVIFAVKSQI